MPETQRLRRRCGTCVCVCVCALVSSLALATQGLETRRTIAPRDSHQTRSDLPLECMQCSLNGPNLARLEFDFDFTPRGWPVRRGHAPARKEGQATILARTPARRDRVGKQDDLLVPNRPTPVNLGTFAPLGLGLDQTPLLHLDTEVERERKKQGQKREKGTMIGEKKRRRRKKSVR